MINLVLGLRIRRGQVESGRELLGHVEIRLLQAHSEDQGPETVHLDVVSLAGPDCHSGVEGRSLPEQV